jgi:hypothetical protein
MSVTDTDVIRAVLAGDRSSFGELYKRHARWVRAVLYDACGDLTQAQDLTQEVFLRAFRGLGNLRDQNRFGPWLMGIARTVGMDWRRCRAVDSISTSAAPSIARHNRGLRRITNQSNSFVGRSRRSPHESGWPCMSSTFRLDRLTMPERCSICLALGSTACLREPGDDWNGSSIKRRAYDENNL